MNPKIDLSQTLIKTKRLVLRPWTKEDLEDFFAYASVDGVGQMAGWLPHQNKEETLKILELFISEKKTLAIEYLGKVIGSIGVEPYNEKLYPDLMKKKARELGYVLSKDYWGQGLMPEAVEAIMDYLFEQIQLDALLCGHFLKNHQSQRVQEKCGFKHYAYGKYQTYYGIIEENEMNILTKEDYEKQKKDLHKM